MNYEWVITSLETRDEVNDEGSTLENAVVRVTWKKIGTDDSGNSATYLGKTTLSAELVNADSFVGFSNLNKETVVGWVTNSINDSEMSDIDAVIQRRLGKNEVVKRNPPWID